MVLHEVYSYDEVADAMFVSIPVDYEFDGVMKVDDGVFLEYDVDKLPKSIEIINASKKFDVEKEDLIDFKTLKLWFNVDGDRIGINLNIKLKNECEMDLNQHIDNNVKLHDVVNAVSIIQ